MMHNTTPCIYKILFSINNNYQHTVPFYCQSDGDPLNDKTVPVGCHARELRTDIRTSSLLNLKPPGWGETPNTTCYRLRDVARIVAPSLSNLNHPPNERNHIIS